MERVYTLFCVSFIELKQYWLKQLIKVKQVTSGIDIVLSTMYKQTFAEEK
jgi:hypothetical protein